MSFTSEKPIVARLDRLHARVVRVPALIVFTTCTRLLLGIGFIPPGLVKVLGHRFTRLGIDTPIGFFFEGFFQSGGYYRFVGIAQVVAGLLLLAPRTALIGALIYLPIILNIFVITVALHFTGTWVITGMMLLANIYLLCWYYDRLRAIPFRDAPPLRPDHRPRIGLPPGHAGTATVAGFGIALAAAAILLLAMEGATPLPGALMLPVFLTGALAGAVGAIAWWRGLRALIPR